MEIFAQLFYFKKFRIQFLVNNEMFRFVMYFLC